MKSFALEVLAVVLPLIFCLVTSTSAQELYEIPEKRSTRWTSFENPTGKPGNGGQENLGAKGHAFDMLEANETKVLADIRGAGIINRIWLTVNERSPKMLRSMRVEMYWDKATTPAVSAPLGDFFGIGLGRRTPFESEFFSDPEGRSFNCLIPMPFKTAARIVIINDSNVPVMLFYDINYSALEKHDKPVYYFHTYWYRERKTTLGKDFTILPEVHGKGRFLGTNVGVIADSIYETSWWGEGEVKMYIDGDKNFPTLIGTGTEDYIGTAWGQGKFAHRFQGCPIADDKARQWCFYRYHVRDPIYFEKNFRATIQQIGGEQTDFVRRLRQKGAQLTPISVAGETFHKILEMNPVPDLMSSSFPQGWTNYYRRDDVSATAYFYLDQPENGLPAIASVGYRTKDLSEK